MSLSLFGKFLFNIIIFYFKLQKKQKEKENLKTSLEDISEHVGGMKKHMTNVLNQLNLNQNLICAHNNQKAAEENLVKLARIEDTSISNDMKRIKKELLDVQEKHKSIQVKYTNFDLFQQLYLFC